MNQKFSLVLFASGLPMFLTTAGEMLKSHATWSEFFATPTGASHLVLLGGSFMSLVVGALGLQLPRASSHNERKEDPDAKGAGA